MNKQVLFIQGAGDEGYKADTALVASLQKILGKEYTINYPEIKSDVSVPDFGWPKQIGKKITEIKNDFILVGHSLGASMILKFLSENSVHKKIDGIFLLATPFWNGKEAWQTGLKLQEDFVKNLPDKTPIYFYHCLDDEEVSFAHLQQYKQKLAQANFREIKTGGHQLNNDLNLVAKDIQSL